MSISKDDQPLVFECAWEVCNKGNWPLSAAGRMCPSALYAVRVHRLC